MADAPALDLAKPVRVRDCWERYTPTTIERRMGVPFGERQPCVGRVTLIESLNGEITRLTVTTRYGRDVLVTLDQIEQAEDADA